MRSYTREEIRAALEYRPQKEKRFTEEDRASILSNPRLTKRLRQLNRAGEELRNVPTQEIPFSAFRRFETDGNRTEYEYADYGYFIRRRKLTTYSILVWLYRREEDIRELENILWAICGEYTWCLPAHLKKTGLTTLQEEGYTIDLFASEVGEGLAETLMLVGDLIHPIVCQRVMHALKARILDLCDRPFGWNTTMRSNWAAVCNGGCGMTAIYAETDVERLSDILVSCINSMQLFLSSFSEDGVCLEGLGYWTYGFGFFTYFADLLRWRTNGAIDLFADEAVHRIATFFGKCFFPGGRYVTFSDSWALSLFSTLPGLVCYLKTIYPDSVLPPDECMDYSYPDTYRSRYARELREFAWVDDAILADPVTASESVCVFPHAEWYLATSASGVSVAAKGGHNDEPHNHNDVGCFTLYRNGQALLVDIGAPEYVRDYFGPNRYTFFAASSASHSVPVINGSFQAGGQSHAARNTRITENGMEMDIAAAYEEETLTALVRKIDFDRVSGTLRLTDTFRFTEAPRSVAERFISEVEPQITEEGVLLRAGGEEVTIRYDKSRMTARIWTEQDLCHEGNGNTRLTYVTELEITEPEMEMTLSFTVS